MRGLGSLRRTRSELYFDLCNDLRPSFSLFETAEGVAEANHWARANVAKTQERFGDVNLQITEGEVRFQHGAQIESRLAGALSAALTCGTPPGGGGSRYRGFLPGGSEAAPARAGLGGGGAGHQQASRTGSRSCGQDPSLGSGRLA
jgi:hypothetical protein